MRGSLRSPSVLYRVNIYLCPGKKLAADSSPAKISQTSENCGRMPVALYHLSKNCCSVETKQRHRHQHKDQQQYQRSPYEILFNGGKLRRRLADALRSERWGSEVEIENPSSEIGGLKALASH